MKSGGAVLDYLGMIGKKIKTKESYMIIEFIQPHALNMGEDFEYLATFIKGKSKPNITNMRLLVKGLKTGREFLLMLNGRSDFFGRKLSYHIEKIDIVTYVNPDHIKGENKTYNYYRLQTDPSDVHKFLESWKSSDPMVHVGSKSHQFITQINNYKGSYRFEGKTY